MSEKRGRQFNHYGNDRGQSQQKKHRPNDQRNQHFSNGYSAGGGGGYRNGNKQGPNQSSYMGGKLNKENQTLLKANELPDPENCQPCKLAAAEMRTGLVSLLDQLVDEEGGPDGDIEIHKSARELRKLLSARGNQALPSKPRLDLDKKRPDTEKYAKIPPIVFKKVEETSAFPPLPAISNDHLQRAVFTHRSISHPGTAAPKGARGGEFNYEQLEFLGDAYLEIIASRLIYSRFPHLETGTQTQLRESLVKNETLAAFSEKYRFSDRTNHTGHMNKNEKGWQKIIADVFEAYVAAVVQSDPEHGFETAETWLTELWAPALLAYEPPILPNPDARKELDNMVQAKGVKLEFREEKPMTQFQGQQRFYMAVFLTGWGYENRFLGRGEWQNKSLANIRAAEDALVRSKDVLDDCWAKKLERRKQFEKEKEEKARLEAAQNGEAPDMDEVAPEKYEKPGSNEGETNVPGEGTPEKKKKKKSKKEKKDGEADGGG